MKGGPLECGVLEFGGRALSEGVGAGLGFCVAGGRLRGHRIRPRIPTGFPLPKWTGKALPRSLPFLCTPAPPSPRFFIFNTTFINYNIQISKILAKINSITSFSIL